METRVKNAVSSLEVGSDNVRIIGIWGMGGGGKTTLARVVFDHISMWFEGKSFVENVREVSKGYLSGLKKMQKQILKDVLHKQSIDVTSVSDGKNMMEKMMPGTKALVVLDDVDDINQLEAFAGELTWFKQGSRIIITTRDRQVLVAHNVNFIHDVSLLSREEAICLFRKFSFKREIPNQTFEELSEKVVRYAAGLPLTIKVLGSHLCGRPKHVWVDTIERLKTIPLEKTLKRLEMTYNGLENDEKEIFLDVICYLKGKSKSAAIKMLESCGFNAQIGLSVLEEKSLVTISNYGVLGFHDHIEELGWNIVRCRHPDEPIKHNRLWIKEEIEDILVNESGTKETKCLKLEETNLHPTIIIKGLIKMKELRFLDVQNKRKWNVDEVCQNLPDALQSISWHGYPFRSLPKTFRANKLVNMEMCGSNISELWERGERKVLDKLKYLNLSWSKLRIFDLEMTPHLETLDLAGCFDFVELYMPASCPKLKFLDLSGSKVSKLNLGMTPHLETLDLAGCFDFVELYMPVSCPKLKFLDLSGSKVSNLNLGMTPHMEELNLEKCYYLQEIHAPVGCLNMLVYLNLSGCSRFEYFLIDKRNVLPRLDTLAELQLMSNGIDICPLHPDKKSRKFQFYCTYDEPLPSSSGNIEKLISFGLCACTNIESFSSSICGLQRLRTLALEGNFLEVPEDLGQLDNLEELYLWMEKIKHLPDSICMLKHLKVLELSCCRL